MTTPAGEPTWPAALGRIPSGLFVVTVGRGPAATGMLASWVQQCSMAPPMVSVAVRAGRPALADLAVGAGFAVNVLGEGQKSLVAHFGKGFEPGQPAFDGVALDPGSDVPVLADALAHLRCEVAGEVPAGDHVLVLGRVVGGRVHHDGRPTVHVRKSGLHY